LREEGFDVTPRKIEGVSSKVILNLIVKTTITTQTTINQTHLPCKESISNHGSLGSYGSNDRFLSQYELDILKLDNEFKEVLKDE
ncbi:hypothetical protein LCGC14_2912880, partial [marine sediment metagenome]